MNRAHMIQSPRTISVDELRDLLDQGQPVTVVDVRPVAERAEWAIPGSIHVDAYEALKAGDPDALAHVEMPVDRPVVTVCAAGKTSRIATEQLRAHGLDARTLVGGMKAWSLAWTQAEIPIAGAAARVIQVRRVGKGCLSYIVGAGGSAAVIDAAVAPEVYLALAREQGWRITNVLDTHVHADHLSRSRPLAERSGVTLRLPAQDRIRYAFVPVRDGDEIRFSGVALAALRNPGHTPESTSYLIEGRALFSGDTLFLNGVGRSDLEASSEEARERAHALYHSLRRLLTLPPETIVLPAHTSAPIPFGGEPVAATLAEVVERVPMLRLPEDAFVTAILARIPATPPNHHRIVDLNEAGHFPDGDPTDLEAGANRCAVS